MSVSSATIVTESTGLFNAIFIACCTTRISVLLRSSRCICCLPLTLTGTRALSVTTRLCCRVWGAVSGFEEEHSDVACVLFFLGWCESYVCMLWCWTGNIGKTQYMHCDPSVSIILGDSSNWSGHVPLDGQSSVVHTIAAASTTMTDFAVNWMRDLTFTWRLVLNVALPFEIRIAPFSSNIATG